MELNSEQQSAVRQVNGPILIIAGAGTGKTKVIISRILHLINEGHAKSNEILALTFTEKAANEVMSRIDEAMPLGYSEFYISTFHAFAQQILREAGLEIGLDPGYKILTQEEQWFFMKKNLFEFELDYYRPLGNPNRFIYSLLSHFSKLKDELISPASYLKFSEENLARLKGDIKEIQDEELEEAEKLLEVAKAYEKYQDSMVQNNYLDFGDLCFYANHLFEKRPSVLKKFSEKFKFILVDEFQDTNYAQFQLILKLANKHGNICVVGDDDQSIYKWRGASLSNILQFEKYFPGAKKIVLTENYRSTQNILDGAYQLIQNNNPDRLEIKIGIDKKLHSQLGVGDPVAVHEFPDFLQETGFVAKQILDLRAKENLSFGDFAILIRANQLSYPFIEEFKALGIPCQVRNPKGLLIFEEIKDLVAVVRIVANPNDDIAFLRILKISVFDISMEEILDLIHQDKNEHIFKSLGKNEDALPGLEAKTQAVYNLIKELIESSKSKTVGQIFNLFLEKSGMLKYLVEKEKFEAVENINEFAKQVARFERENPENSVSDFVNYLNLLDEASGVLEGSTFPDKDAVQILTTHGSKGLEFEYVFVVNTVNQRFPGTRRSEPFEIPEALTKEIYPEGDFHIQEERRLFYVAMTRAKKKLFVTYSKQYEGNKMWKVSPFVKEIMESSSVKFEQHETTDDAVKKLSEFKAPKISIFELSKFSSNHLSYSQFDTFKTCPLKYNYRYVLKVPVLDHHAANFGSSVHNTLNEIYRLLRHGFEVDLKKIKELYERNWISAGYESKEHERVRRESGLKILGEFCEKNSKPWIIPAFLEQPFNLKVEKYFISGRIDRIDKLEDGTYEVIDYKTGRFKDGKDITKDLQLSIYALACRDILKIPVSRLSLYYLEDNEKISTARKAEQLDKLPEEILALVKGIEGSDSAPTPGFHCQFCDFRLICPAV